MFEKSIGIVPIKEDCENSNKILYFIIQHKNGFHFGFPKGHQNENESYLQTATRELREETNLEIEKVINEKDPIKEHYTCVKKDENIEKDVFYFLAFVKGEIKLDENEIIFGSWMSYEEAFDKITFDQSKNILKKAHNIIKNENI